MGARIEHLDATLVESLCAADAYPRDRVAAAGVTHIQTHLSHVFLTEERVYKLHKAVDLGFVSFATQRERNLDCVREVELNRRLAPDTYLGIAPLERHAGRWRPGTTIRYPGSPGSGEHLVVMRRLPDGRDALHLLESNQLGYAGIERLARRIAAFHAGHGLGRPSPFGPEAWRERISRPVEANFESMLGQTEKIVSETSVFELQRLAREAADRLGPAFERRRLEGRAVNGHGDLHLPHVWFESDEAEPIVIDCIAFNEELRRIDAASDLAFLAMDLGSRGRADLGELLLATYAAAADDFGLYRVIDYFISYRAAVRAKVSVLEAIDMEVPEAQRAEAAERARQRLDFAARALARRPTGRVYLVGGVIGTGKTTVAHALARCAGAVVLSSDVIRRYGEPRSEAPVGGSWRSGRYRPDRIDTVYAAMLDRADAVVAAGRDVVLDASWSTRARRERARDWAHARGADASFLEARCPPAVALARLAARRDRGGDASEAGPELYEPFAASYECVDEWPSDTHAIIETDQPDWREQLPRLVAKRG